MKYGLIGKTLVHSYSKEIHEALGKYTYDLFSLAPEEMPGFIKTHDFGGLNVTIPYKQDVMPLCDEITELASAIGAVNTLYRRDGKLTGHNTDYEGFLYSAKRAGISFAGKTVLILGSGGTSLMARKAIADEGAGKIFIASRSGGAKRPAPNAADSKNAEVCGTDSKNTTGCSATPENASGCSAAPKNVSGCNAAPKNVSGCSAALSPADATASEYALISYGELPKIADAVQVIVNTTPVGTYPNTLEAVIDLSVFHACEAVMDVIYNPFKTRLLLDAEKRGLKYSNGLPMLVAQATAAAGWFLGTPHAFDGENERIIKKLQAEMQNIVLIGMPGCGKTSIGRLLAESTGKTFVDMDDEIVKKAGISIPEIFSKSGEQGFRNLESQIALELGKERGQIIATGGGAVLRPENVDALKQNGVMLHILRPVDVLPTGGRPLSKDIDALKEMEKIRMPIYRAAADLTFDNSKTRPAAELLSAVAAVLGL